MIVAIAAFLRALASFWELRAIRYKHDLIEQSRDKIETLEDDIEELRDTGTIDSSDLADRVFNRLKHEKEYFEYLSNSNTKDNQRN